MGGDFLDEESEEASPEESYPMGTVFENQCPYFMSLGMTWEEYWHGDNTLPRAYLKKFEIERDRENISQWRLGQYMMSAIAASLSDKNKYPEEPFPLTEEQAREQKDRAYRRKMELFKRSLMAEQRMKKDGG